MGKDNSVTGFNIGTNVGESAGQTIFHAHIHLIPRRNDDTPHPRGGGERRDSRKNVILRKKDRFWPKQKIVEWHRERRLVWRHRGILTTAI